MKQIKPSATVSCHHAPVTSLEKSEFPKFSFSPSLHPSIPPWRPGAALVALIMHRQDIKPIQGHSSSHTFPLLSGLCMCVCVGNELWSNYLSDCTAIYCLKLLLLSTGCDTDCWGGQTAKDPVGRVEWPRKRGEESLKEIKMDSWKPASGFFSCVCVLPCICWIPVHRCMLSGFSHKCKIPHSLQCFCLVEFSRDWVGAGKIWANCPIVCVGVFGWEGSRAGPTQCGGLGEMFNSAPLHQWFKYA